MKTVFVTGATGFVGRHLLPRLSRYEKVFCLARSAKGRPADCPGNVEWISGDLNDPATYGDALRQVHSVIHLAALTGKARPADYARVNVEGTRALVATARDAKVENFLHVSSVAVKFPNKRNYPYGQSKEDGEAIVRASGARYTIVRPAIILGAGSPTWKGLRPMLKLPVMPVFGDGRTPIQPIHVEDIAFFLDQILERATFRGETLEFGGPEVLTFEQLLQRAREKRAGKRAFVVHVPLGPVAVALSLMEPLLFSVLPITAGQLSSFRYGGVMDANPLWEEYRGKLKTIPEMLE